MTRITRLPSIMKHINFSPFASAPLLLSSSAAHPLCHRHDLLRRHCARSPPPPPPPPPPRELLCLSPAAELTSPAPLGLSSCGPLTLWAGRPLRHWRPGLGGSATVDMEKKKDRWMAVPAHSLRRRAQAGEPQPPLLLCVLASERKKGLLSGVCSSVRE